MRKKKGGILVTYTESMIECLESNLMLLKEELACLDHYPELTGTVITKIVRCSRPNCAACAAGFFHGPNVYYRYYENGALKDKYLGKKIRDEYIRKTEANKKYDAVSAEIREIERELERLKTMGSKRRANQ